MEVSKIIPLINKSFYKGKMKLDTQEGIVAIFKGFEKHQIKDTRWISYMLATAYHETASTMCAIEEFGKGKTRPYGKKLKNSGISYVTPNVIYYGRGLVQLTWYENYQLMGRLLNIDLLHFPELALNINIAVEIMIEGMTKGSSSFGDFTGKCLEMYFNDKITDWIGARRIINGKDKAELIATHAKSFYHILTSLSA